MCWSSQSWLVVTQSGAGSSDEPRSRPRTDAIYLALDPDLGLDPSPGSAVLQIRVLCEPEEAKILNF